MTIKKRLVIIGAGIVGSSTAYYLAQMGWKDVLVIDKGDLFENDGSTSHAPGGVNPLSNSTVMAKFSKDAIDLYESLPLWGEGRKPLYMVGGLDVARTEERMYEVKRLYTNAKGFGVQAQMIEPEQIPELFPLMDPSHFVGALFTPRKPVVAGPHVCGSLTVEAEKTGGVKFIGNTMATGLIKNGNRVTGVTTNNPEMPLIECEQVLLCTNIWTPAISEKVGVNIPLLSAEHQYVKSEPLPELAHVSDRDNANHEIIYPSVRDLDGGVYYRHWWDSMGMGSYHHRPIMVDPRTLGKSADHPFTPEDFVDAHKMAVNSIPALKGRNFPYAINGMFSFSVDGMPILGETNVNGLWVATSIWVSQAGGVGKAMAQWMTHGEAEVDLRQVNVNRFLPYQKTQKFIDVSCAKSYEEVHDVHHPAQWASKPRHIRHTPFYQRHVEMDAQFLPSAGLEIPYWLNENVRLLETYEAQVPDRSGWSAMYWSRIQGAEHLAMRDSAGLFDLTGLAIIEVEGEDALNFMNYATTSQMDIPVGRVAYTLLCTPTGGIKRDVTVSRNAEDKFWIYTGNGTLMQELDWLRRLVTDQKVAIRDQSQTYAALGLFGPNARKILEKVTPNDVSNEAFPFYSWQNLEIGMSSVFAMRISYVGELGWELHMPMDVALAVRDELWQAGQEFGLISAGVGAMRSMRVEKGYRLWGSDVYTEHNPYESGMGWMVKLKKGDFVGRDALVKLRKEPRTRQLVTLTLDDPNVLLTGNEPIFHNDTMLGQVTSGNYGYSVGTYIAFGYVPTEFAKEGTQLEVEYLAERYTVKITADCLFDPKNERLKS